MTSKSYPFVGRISSKSYPFVGRNLHIGGENLHIGGEMTFYNTI
jgi:hypothetical protein